MSTTSRTACDAMGRDDLLRTLEMFAKKRPRTGKLFHLQSASGISQPKSARTIGTIFVD
jgi:hypothetical protein